MKRFISMLSVLLLTITLSLPLFAGDTTVVTSGRVAFAVLVDEDMCVAPGISMCVDTGSAVPAASGNSSVVGIHVHLRNRNGPITGLAELDFEVYAVTNPNGTSPVFARTGLCASCFSEPQPGVYRLAIKPANGNWITGTWVTKLEVSLPNGVAETIIPIDIP